MLEKRRNLEALLGGSFSSLALVIAAVFRAADSVGGNVCVTLPLEEANGTRSTRSFRRGLKLEITIPIGSFGRSYPLALNAPNE